MVLCLKYFPHCVVLAISIYLYVPSVKTLQNEMFSLDVLVYYT